MLIMNAVFIVTLFLSSTFAKPYVPAATSDNYPVAGYSYQYVPTSVMELCNGTKAQRYDLVLTYNYAMQQQDNHNDAYDQTRPYYMINNGYAYPFYPQTGNYANYNGYYGNNYAPNYYQGNVAHSGVLVRAKRTDNSTLPQVNLVSRIMNGKDTTIDKVPYQVHLEYYDFGFCGGSIISANWVITAAHCLTYRDELVRLRAGSARKSDPGSVHCIVESVKHENYHTNANKVPVNDIALLRVEPPFVMDNTRQPIELFNDAEEVTAGAPGVISGWGKIGESSTDIPEVLQMAMVPVIGKNACGSIYSRYGGLPFGQICAADLDDGKDSCQGDSGGPMVVGGRLAGIVSWGVDCGTSGFPGFYTEVAAYRKWIREKSGV